jgi:hypothetical protein
MQYELYHGNCWDLLDKIDLSAVDAVVTDPPYGIDGGAPGGRLWYGYSGNSRLRLRRHVSLRNIPPLAGGRDLKTPLVGPPGPIAWQFAIELDG